MKKFLVLTAIVFAAACNQKAARTENIVDSTADAISDSLENKADSLRVTGDTSEKRGTDSLQKGKTINQ
jgi:hypothetical protein